MSNETLIKAQAGKNDEFYTQYRDIEVEMKAYLEYDPNIFRGKTILLPCDDPERSNFTKYFASEFETLGLKKLISTCYVPDNKRPVCGGLSSDYPLSTPYPDGDELKPRGKILILDSDDTGNTYDLHWEYLQGDGDFRSDEITALRDEADMVITNPPFSLFREFLAWLTGADKQFIIIGNINAITYKGFFSLIMENKVWLGATIHGGDREFEVPQEYPLSAAGWRIDESGRKFVRVKGVRWFTNIGHGRQHEPLALMSMADNLRSGRHKGLKEKDAYRRYDNYDAIEVPFTDAIPSDYDGVMGVPVSWLDKYCSGQFEILGITENPATTGNACLKDYLIPGQPNYSRPYINGRCLYSRVLIRRKS